MSRADAALVNGQIVWLVFDVLLEHSQARGMGELVDEIVSPIAAAKASTRRETPDLSTALIASSASLPRRLHGAARRLSGRSVQTADPDDRIDNHVEQKL
jgi:hypothetical protein